MLDLNQALLYLALINSFLSLIGVVYTFVTSGARLNGKRMDALEERLTLDEKLTQRIADQLADLPRRESLHSLELTLARMEGQMMTLDERLKPVAAIAERMQETLLAQHRGS